MATIAFDVYGTLIDTNGVVSRLREWIGSQAEVFSQTWRSKQLEYSFRRGLMRRYENFAVCTRQALEEVCLQTGWSVHAYVLMGNHYHLLFEKPELRTF
jgi:2-haloacid dehalogenase